MKYNVTMELKTPWWRKLSRCLKIVKPREEFEILMNIDSFNTGDILQSDGDNTLKIIDKNV